MTIIVIITGTHENGSTLTQSRSSEDVIRTVRLMKECGYSDIKAEYITQ